MCIRNVISCPAIGCHVQNVIAACVHRDVITYDNMCILCTTILLYCTYYALFCFECPISLHLRAHTSNKLYTILYIYILYICIGAFMLYIIYYITMEYPTSIMWIVIQYIWCNDSKRTHKMSISRKYYTRFRCALHDILLISAQ